VSYSGHLMKSYLHRSGQPGPGQKDAGYQYEWAVLRDLLGRLEVILDDEGIPPDKAERVMRCLLYGSPHAPDADLRMEQQAEMVKLLGESARPAFVVPGAHLAADLGLPPR
jgi:hypothetical protein